jgi:hypothetical protein
MFDFLNDWKAWSARERAAVATVGLGVAIVVLRWLSA